MPEDAVLAYTFLNDANVDDDEIRYHDIYISLTIDNQSLLKQSLYRAQAASPKATAANPYPTLLAAPV